MRIRYLTALTLGVASAPVLAHHGWSSYDETKPVTLSGTLYDVNWGNPHGTAAMRWQGKQWNVVLAPTDRMDARGLTQQMIAPSERIMMTGYARRDGTAEMRIERVIAKGKTVELR